jgi:predicted ATPase/class 3 adenylate cyclase
VTRLPSGTVSLLFSDIEGSTVLLSRLGPSYVDALTGQRLVLRKAWTGHRGVELGTEGDSFFVAFPTAGDAVAAAVQAQREMAAYPWPGGEHVRVRIGIHTGTPQIHDGDYVGMDVHRAARIAATAHGGQVVVSSVTAELARGGLPDGVSLRDLGDHQLKDIPFREHLLQVDIDGLQTEFPALRSIGTASSLPSSSTVLVGREREIQELCALVEEPDVRLVTLTGPGGSGKTRLAIAAAGQLKGRFSDGVFFVALAGVTTAEVMWTSIAAVLDVPPTARTPPRLFDHVDRLSALFVLDNLEQLSGADDVVAQLIDAAPEVVVVVTSRRALSLPAEHRHRVPPLSLPADVSLAGAQGSSAVRLFVERARAVAPGFAVTGANVADIVAICRRLDGLPLAIELCAARMRLLTPAALLRRIDSTLDLSSPSQRGPRRQKTLRSTVAWSYDLLSAPQQAFFRRLGVFAGGADLDAITAVVAEPSSGAHEEPLDQVADLVDASLAVITEGPDGEPRVTLLETIRAYALDELQAADEAAAVRTMHLRHYLAVAEHLHSSLESQHLRARGVAELELDNFRAALTWALERDADPAADPGGAWIGLRLCSALGWLWWIGGYVLEGRRWYERMIDEAGDTPSRPLAACLGGLANLVMSQGDTDRALDLATSSLAMARALGDDERVALSLGIVGTAQLTRGDDDAARATFEEALRLHRELGNPGRLGRALGHLAGIEETLGHFDRAEELTHESLSIFDRLGDIHEATAQQQNLANLLAVAGRVDEAYELAAGLVDRVLQLRSPNLTMAFANTCMNILIRLGEPVPAAHLVGAEEALRDRLMMPNPYRDEEMLEVRSLVHDLISVEEWEEHCRSGHDESLEDLLARFSAAFDHPWQQADNVRPPTRFVR